MALRRVGGGDVAWVEERARRRESFLGARSAETLEFLYLLQLG